MQEKVIEILVYLINEMRKNKQLGEVDLEVLVDSGYTQAEISTAFGWLFDKINLEESPITLSQPSSAHSHRIFHEAEKIAFSTEAQGYLLQLREIGLISDKMLEMVIDRIMITGFAKASLQDVKSMIASLMFDHDDTLRTGSRFVLNTRDTIH